MSTRIHIGPLFEELTRDHASDQNSSPFADGAPIYIYGAGSAARDLCDVLIGRGRYIVGFLDRAAQPGATIKGIPLLHPDDAAIEPDRRQDSHVVLGIFNGYVDLSAIRDWLTDLGYGKLCSFAEVYDEFATDLGQRFWLTSRDFYRGTEEVNRKAMEVFSDEDSRVLYLANLRYRMTRDIRTLPQPDVHNQYFDPCIAEWPQPLRFIDCGAYDGDTLKQLVRTNLSIESIVAFEPDVANFARLCRYVAEHREQLPSQVYLYPCGVEAVSRQLRFSSTQGTASHVDPNGNTVTPCVAIDEVLHGFAPNFIKMDVEGAELAALAGARRTIERHRPHLAICLYHRPEHLWQVPLQLRDWYGANAKFYLRSHGYSGFELVLYVIPS